MEYVSTFDLMEQCGITYTEAVRRFDELVEQKRVSSVRVERPKHLYKLTVDFKPFVVFSNGGLILNKLR